MAGKPAVVPVYWDTNVFISIFDGGKSRSEEEMEGLLYWKALADDGNALVVTSTITYAEVLRGHNLDDGQVTALERFMAGLVDIKDVSIGVVRRAREYREFYHARRKAESTALLCLPDALHMATADIFGCQEFQTYDRHTKRGCVGLLKLTALPDRCPFRVCVPEAPPKPLPELSMFEQLEWPQVGKLKEESDGRSSSTNKDGAEEARPGAGTPQVGGGLDGPGKGSTPSAPPPAGLPEAPEQGPPAEA
jgi:predicted nucleic acid-binding protein